MNVQKIWENWKTFQKENEKESNEIDEEYCCEYTLEAFERERMPFGEDDYSPDGTYIFVEQLPSNLTPWSRYASRLKIKFGIERKAAQIAAFMLYYITNNDRECKKWFEEYMAENGFENTYNYLNNLFWELYKEDLSYDPEKTYSIEEIMLENTGEGHTFRALKIKDEPEEEENIDPPDEKTKLFREYSNKIRRAGIHQISKIGIDLYNKTKERLFHYKDATTLFEQYRMRKAYLEENYGYRKIKT